LQLRAAAPWPGNVAVRLNTTMPVPPTTVAVLPTLLQLRAAAGWFLFFFQQIADDNS